MTSAPHATAAPSEYGDWADPGLVDRAGTAIVVPLPRATTGASLNVIDFGADPLSGPEDDAVAIRRAIAQAEEGDEVVLPPGVFDLRTVSDLDDSAAANGAGEAANVVLPSGVALRGAGGGQTILRSHLDGMEDSAVLRARAAHDIAITGLTITSDYDGTLGVDPADREAGGGPMYGISIGTRDGAGSSRVLIDRVHVERFQRHGISLKGSREVTVTGCHVSSATGVGPGGAGYGIVVEGFSRGRTPGSDDDARHNAIVGNTFDGEHLRHAILLQFTTHNNLVADNVIRGSILDAIDLHGEGEYLNEVRDNEVSDGAAAGIALGNSGGQTHKHDASGRGNWIHGNTLTNNRRGVLVILGTPQTIVENNNITAGKASRSGIELRNAPGTAVRSNTVTGPGPRDFWAIRLLEDHGADGRGKGVPQSIRIEGNVLRHVANGIGIDAGNGIRLTRNVLADITGTEVRVAKDADVTR